MRARGRLLEAGEHAHQRGLAAAGRAEQAEELALEDVERQMIDRDGVAEPLGDVLEADERLGFGIGPGRKGAAHGADGIVGTEEARCFVFDLERGNQRASYDVQPLRTTT